MTDADQFKAALKKELRARIDNDDADSPPLHHPRLRPALGEASFRRGVSGRASAGDGRGA